MSLEQGAGGICVEHTGLVLSCFTNNSPHLSSNPRAQQSCGIPSSCFAVRVFNLLFFVFGIAIRFDPSFSVEAPTGQHQSILNAIATSWRLMQCQRLLFSCRDLHHLWTGCLTVRGALGQPRSRASRTTRAVTLFRFTPAELRLKPSKP